MKQKPCADRNTNGIIEVSYDEFRILTRQNAEANSEKEYVNSLMRGMQRQEDAEAFLQKLEEELTRKFVSPREKSFSVIQKRDAVEFIKTSFKHLPETMRFKVWDNACKRNDKRNNKQDLWSGFIYSTIHACYTLK